MHRAGEDRQQTTSDQSTTATSHNQTPQLTLESGGLNIDLQALIDAREAVREQLEQADLIKLPNGADDSISEAQPTPEPAAGSAPEPAPEPAPDPAASADPEAAATPDPEPAPEPAAKPDSEPAPEPAAEPEPEPAPEPAPTPDLATVPEAAAEPEPALEEVAESDPEPVPEPAAEPDPEPAPKPTVTPVLNLDITPNPVKPGQIASINWTSQGVNYCQASGAWAGEKALDGQQQVGPFEEDQRFLLSCSEGGSGINQEVYLVVQNSGPVKIDLLLNRKKVLSGKQVTLKWKAENADRCVASGGWQGDQAATGEYVSQPLLADTTFKLTCMNASARATGLVSAQIKQELLRWISPSSYSDGSPMEIGGYKVYWGVAPNEYTSQVQLPPSAQTWTADLDPGTYYVAMATIDTSGTEGELSPEITLQVE